MLKSGDTIASSDLDKANIYENTFMTISITQCQDCILVTFLTLLRQTVPSSFFVRRMKPTSYCPTLTLQKLMGPMTTQQESLKRLP